MSITGLTVETKDFRFDILKQDNGRFEIRSDGIRIEFSVEDVEIKKSEFFKPEIDPHNAFAVVMSVKWGCGHKVHFQAYMPLRSAQDLNKYFPELKLDW